MFSLSSTSITNAISTGTNEAMILYRAMMILAENPNTRVTDMVTELNKQASPITGGKELTYAGVEHYFYCAKMYLRLYNAIANKVAGYSFLREKDYIRLISSGIILCDKAYQLLRIRDDSKFLAIMKSAADFLQENAVINTKERISTFLNSEFSKMSIQDFTPSKNGHHDLTRNLVGMQYLRRQGCVFVTREAVLEKQDKTTGKSGLRLDVYGWKNDSTIIGMEVKAKKSDFEGTLFEERFGRYSEYCNEFYILTTDEVVFKVARQWCAHHRGTAALFYDGHDACNLHTTKMQPTHRKPTEQMIQKAQEILVTKIKKQISEIYLDATDCTPDAVVRKIKNNLSKEIPFENNKEH